VRVLKVGAVIVLVVPAVVALWRRLRRLTGLRLLTRQRLLTRRRLLRQILGNGAGQRRLRLRVLKVFLVERANAVGTMLRILRVHDLIGRKGPQPNRQPPLILLRGG